LIVWYWFKYQAKSGGMLIIDEPELNLHPANQRRLARFLVALVNHGVKVFITTHSDYIVREFNTLIMLNKVDVETNPTLVPLSDYSHKDRLDPAKVNLYMAQQVSMKRNGATRKSQVRTLVKADVDESLGIEVASFDNTIIDMNEVQNFIRYEVLG
jgi:ABC-type multidrug transport system ATPase subunit